jgi:beta-xylosidase
MVKADALSDGQELAVWHQKLPTCTKRMASITSSLQKVSWEGGTRCWVRLNPPAGLTEFGHCATMASAPSVWGPFTPCPSNPVLGAASPTSLFQTVGHADLFSGTDSQWWVVCLASRVVGEGRPIGRESVLMKVDWSGEWPIVDHSAIDVPVSSITSAPSQTRAWKNLLASPRHHLLHLRNPPADAIRFVESGTGSSTMLLRPQRGHCVPLTAPFGTPVFCGVRQTDLHFECRAELRMRGMAGTASVAEAGLAVYLDPERHLTIGTDGTALVFTRVQPGAEPDAPTISRTHVSLPATQPCIALRVRGTPDRYTLEYSTDELLDQDAKWEALGEGPTSEVSGGFTGVILAIYAVGLDSGNDTDSMEGIEVGRWEYRAMV